MAAKKKPVKSRYDTASAFINGMFSDTSVPKRETLDCLKSLRADIDIFMDALENDIRKEEWG